MAVIANPAADIALMATKMIQIPLKKEISRPIISAAMMNIGQYRRTSDMSAITTVGVPRRAALARDDPLSLFPAPPHVEALHDSLGIGILNRRQSVGPLEPRQAAVAGKFEPGDRPIDRL